MFPELRTQSGRDELRSRNEQLPLFLQRCLSKVLRRSKHTKLLADPANLAALTALKSCAQRVGRHLELHCSTVRINRRVKHAVDGRRIKFIFVNVLSFCLFVCFMGTKNNVPDRSRPISSTEQAWASFGLVPPTLWALKQMCKN
jgi:hypothetical protein